MGALVAAEPMYSNVKSSVMNLNKMNYDKQVGMNREKGISVVQFYNSIEDKSKASKGQFEKFSMEHKQMFRVGAIDCHDTAALCKKLDVDTTILPYFRVLPPTPIPA